MAHFGKSSLVVYFCIAVNELNVSGGYEGISLFPDFITMRSIVQFRLGILNKILGLPVEIYLTYSVYVRFCQTDIFLLVGVQVIVFSLMNNWVQVTNGPLGIANIPALEIGGYVFESRNSFLALSLFFAFVIYLLISRIVKTSFGYTLQSLSEDEIYTASLGKNVYLSKLTAFTLSGMLAAIPGVLYAYYVSYIDPSSFTVNESIFILSITIIGGQRNLRGSLFAASFLVVLPELLSLIGLPNSISANIKQIIYGMLLILVTAR